MCQQVDADGLSPSQAHHVHVARFRLWYGPNAFHGVLAAYACLSFTMPGHESGADLGEGQLDARSTHPNTSLEAARLELMVLRVALPLSATIGDARLVTFSGGMARLTTEQAAGVLSGLSKPLVCAASNADDGTLLITCKPVTTDDENNTYLSVMGATDQHLGSESESDSARYVRVTGRREAKRFSLDVIRRWSREYVIPHTIGFGHWPAPTGLSDREDVEEVLELLHIDNVKTSDAPTEP